jgi:hypothetical protein
MSLLGTARWRPETANDCELVLRELSVLLASSHFRNSKRYPTLLNHVVSKALDGRTDQLKERTLGIEVFGREPDYDTSADPVVRVTAAEIRKRLAQHYHEHGSDFGVEIDLPLGCYVPNFRRSSFSEGSIDTFLPGEHAIDRVTSESPKESPSLPSPALATVSATLPIQRRFSARSIIVFGALLLALISVTGYFAQRRLQDNISDRFWAPLLKSPGTVLTVVPTSLHGGGEDSVQDGVDLNSLSHGPYNHISMCDAVALSHFASFLGTHAKPFEVKEANLTGLGDVHHRSTILLGALNNHWTMDLTESMRFHFVKASSSVTIVDSQNPHNRDWSIDYTRPYAYAKHDYAIIARYMDPATGGNILIIAGIGAMQLRLPASLWPLPLKWSNSGIWLHPVGKPETWK